MNIWSNYKKQPLAKEQLLTNLPPKMYTYSSFISQIALLSRGDGQTVELSPPTVPQLVTEHSESEVTLEKSLENEYNLLEFVNPILPLMRYPTGRVWLPTIFPRYEEPKEFEVNPEELSVLEPTIQDHIMVGIVSLSQTPSTTDIVRPTGQRVQLDAPFGEEYHFAQSKHSVNPVELENFPIGQS
jgi:hypothetical protein